jgi:hypothetical protein
MNVWNGPERQGSGSDPVYNGSAIIVLDRVALQDRLRFGIHQCVDNGGKGGGFQVGSIATALCHEYNPFARFTTAPSGLVFDVCACVEKWAS